MVCAVFGPVWEEFRQLERERTSAQEVKTPAAAEPL
jgi:hypothetical protein